MSSEIARLRQQIELESAAMKLALHGFAAVGKHEFISHKYDAIGKCQEQLERLVGEEKASGCQMALRWWKCTTDAANKASCFGIVTHKLSSMHPIHEFGNLL